MGGVVDGTCHCTGLLAGGCGSMRSCIFLIFMPADFTPCIFAFLITEVLMDKVSGGPLDVMALVLRCFTTTGECFCSEEDAAGTGSGRSRRSPKSECFSFSGERGSVTGSSSVFSNKEWCS